MGELGVGHWALVLFVAIGMFGMPFVAGYFVGRYVEMRKNQKDWTQVVAEKMSSPR